MMSEGTLANHWGRNDDDQRSKFPRKLVIKLDPWPEWDGGSAHAPKIHETGYRLTSNSYHIEIYA